MRDVILNSLIDVIVLMCCGVSFQALVSTWKKYTSVQNSSYKSRQKSICNRSSRSALESWAELWNQLSQCCWSASI